jgi:hypothetical protein
MDPPGIFIYKTFFDILYLIRAVPSRPSESIDRLITIFPDNQSTRNSWTKSMSGPWPLSGVSRRTRRSSPPDPCNNTTTSVHAMLPCVAKNRSPTGCPLHSQ